MNVQNGISVTIQIKKNLGNYENIMLEASASLVDVDPKDSKAWDELWGVVDNQIATKLAEVEEVK